MFRDLLTILQNNKAFLYLLAMIPLFAAAAALMQKCLVYFVKYGLAAHQEQHVVLFVHGFTAMLATPLWAVIAHHRGRRSAWKYSTSLMVVAAVLMFVLTARSLPLFLLLLFPMSVAFAAMGVLFWSMLPDTIEYGQWRTGFRAESLFFGIASFAQKLSIGVAGWVLGGTLGAVGVRAEAVRTPVTILTLKIRHNPRADVPARGLPADRVALPAQRALTPDDPRSDNRPGEVRMMRFPLLVSLFVVGLHCQAAERPNILLLVAEDLSPRIGSFGDPVADTPHIDALARRGVRFTNAFTTAGVCAPSRAALVTGMHQISIGAQHMRASSEGYLAVPPPEVKAFPELLRAAGYYTFTDGKLDYQFSDVFAGTGPFPIWDDEGESAGWAGRKAGQPFFGLINFPETHESRLRRHWREDGRYVAPAVTDPAALQLPPYYPDVAAVRRDLARHYDNVHYMDARVGSLLDELESQGLADSTIVIWTTDHGDGLPRAKREVYDSGIKVPLILYIPPRFALAGRAVGESDARLVSFVDIAPTILSLAGVETPGYVHGRNFLSNRRDYVFAARDRIDEVNDRQRAARDKHYKYIRSYVPALPGGHELEYRDNIEMVALMREMFHAGKLSPEQARWFEPPGAEQLYDLRTDPFELQNLAASPEHRPVLDRMRAALDHWLRTVEDWSEQPEPAMRQRFLSPEGEIRTTPAPVYAWQGRSLMLQAVDGASIGYRFDDGPWQLYTSPFPAAPGIVETRAVRYGWRASEIRRIIVPADIAFQAPGCPHSL